jgi:hypothetical protein
LTSITPTSVISGSAMRNSSAVLASNHRRGGFGNGGSMRFLVPDRETRE